MILISLVNCVLAAGLLCLLAGTSMYGLYIGTAWIGKFFPSPSLKHKDLTWTLYQAYTRTCTNIIIFFFFFIHLELNKCLSRFLCVLAIWSSIFLGGRKGEHNWLPLIHLLCCLRIWRNGHSPPIGLYFYIQVGFVSS